MQLAAELGSRVDALHSSQVEHAVGLERLSNAVSTVDDLRRGVEEARAIASGTLLTCKSLLSAVRTSLVLSGDFFQKP
jgi:hypothetical protein